MTDHVELVLRLRERIDQLLDRCAVWEERCDLYQDRYETVCRERDDALQQLWDERDDWKRERGNIRRLLRAARESRDTWRERFRAEHWGARHS